MSVLFDTILPAELIWNNGLPYSTAYQDPYFSSAGGLEEARHVFIQGNQLIARWKASCSSEHSIFVIGETGFGSGLNFLLSSNLWQKHAHPNAWLHFISCEKHPLTLSDLATCMALWPDLQAEAAMLLDVYPTLTPGFHYLTFPSHRVTLTLFLGDAHDCYQQLLICNEPRQEAALRPFQVSAWFLDGFSPAKNPAMWDTKLLQTLHLLSHPNTTLATFTVASHVRNSLSASGFDVKKEKGFARKREMLTGKYNNTQTQNSSSSAHGKPFTAWHHFSTPSRLDVKQATIVGAGLAGSFLANALARRGWSIRLVDEKPHAGSGASGNPQAILYPMFSLYRSPLAEFMLTAYLFAVRAYQKILKSHSPLSGILQLAYSSKIKQNQQQVGKFLSHYPQLASIVDAKQASELAGVNLNVGGIFIPDAGWINSAALCEALIDHPRIQFEQRLWCEEEMQQGVVVLCNGYRAASFSQTAHLPIKPIQGQTTTLLASEMSRHLKIPICAQGHVLPVFDGVHHCGATYHVGESRVDRKIEDDFKNLEMLKRLPLCADWSNEAVGSWSGVRASTPDYLPIVGAVADEALFTQHFSSLATNSNRWIPYDESVYLQKLFVCAGFGSRGLTTIPLATEWLAATLNQEPAGLSRQQIQSLSPARFLRRNIIRSAKEAHLQEL